jgi:hypothetical protein
VRCLSCQSSLRAQEARLWDKRIVLCAPCADRADRAKAELESAQARARHEALLQLDQMVLSGALLEAQGLDLPGFGDV